MELIDISSLFIQSVNLAVIIFVLWKFLFSPYLRFLDEEAKKRTKLEEQIQKQSYILEDAHNQATNIVDQAKLDAKIIASEITENARKESAEIIANAQADADAARTKWFADIAYERKLIAEELKWKVIDIALKMNEKLFGKNESNIEFLKNNAKNIEF
jgi:F-type H+-transporting ATPase subunit b